MRFIASRLGFEAHLACIEIILDGVSVAHFIVLVLRVIVYLLEQAVGGHEPVVVHLQGAMLGGLHFPTVDAAAAQERQPIAHVKRIFPAAVQHGSQAKGSIFLKHNKLKRDEARISKPMQAQNQTVKGAKN